MDEEPKTYVTDDDELVARYVLGTATPDEQRRIEAEIAEFAPGREKVRREMELAAGIRRHGRDLMKAALRNRLRRDRSGQFTMNHYIGLAAAVVIVAIGLGVYQLWFSDLTAPKQFHQQEVVLQPQEEELPAEEPVNEEAVSETLREEPVPEQEKKVERAGSSAVQAEQKENKQLAADADAESAPTAAVTAEAAAPAQPQAIWLIGTVVMVRDGSGPVSALQQRSVGKQQGAERAAAAVKRKASDERIELRQRAIADLPAELAQRSKGPVQRVQTLLERTESGLSLTLYGDAVKDDELRDAVIEQFTDDSLVVSLLHQRIAFRLPPGWGPEGMGK